MAFRPEPERPEPERPEPLLLALGFFAVDLFAADFRALDPVAVDFFPALDLLAVDFFRVDLLTVDFLRPPGAAVVVAATLFFRAAFLRAPLRGDVFPPPCSSPVTRSASRSSPLSTRSTSRAVAAPRLTI